MNKVQKIKMVMMVTKCSRVEAEIALDNNRWDDDLAIIELLESPSK